MCKYNNSLMPAAPHTGEGASGSCNIYISDYSGVVIINIIFNCITICSQVNCYVM